MKDSFILYTEQKEVIDKLSDEQAGKLIKAIYSYAKNGEMPQLDAVLDLVVIPFKSALDRNDIKWQETKKKRSEAGKLGAKIKQDKVKQANANFVKQDEANQAVNVNDNVNGNVSVNVNENDNDNKLYEHFEKIWELYPVKKGKSKAETYFFSWIKGRKINGRIKKLTDKEMWYAVSTYLKELEETKQDLQYVPHGSTFFNTKIYDYYEIWKEKNNGR